MKKVRLFTLLCVMALIFGSLSFAFADSGSAMHLKGADAGRTIGNNSNFFLLKNKKAVTFYIFTEHRIYAVSKERLPWGKLSRYPI